MVTLLIASIAVAASAPLFTKRNQVNKNNASLWLLTQNSMDITRTNGKVGINVPTNRNPDSFLDIRSRDTNASNLLTIRRGNNVVFSINSVGETVINLPSAGKALSVQQGGTENAFIETNGTIKGTQSNMYKASGRVFQSGTSDGDVTAWINADGSSSFGVPRDAVMFFWASTCPAGGDWAPLPATAKNAYVRIVGQNPGDLLGQVRDPILPDIQATFSGVGQYYADKKHSYAGTYTGAMKRINKENSPKEGAKVGNDGASRDDYISFKASRYNSIYQEGNSVHPKNISLIACRKIR